MTAILRRREPVIAGAVLLAAAIVAANLPGGAGRHALPTAILFRSLVDGLIASLLAAGIVVLYRSLRIVNFAQISLSIAGAVLAFDLAQLIPGFPAFLAIAIGLAASAAMGAGMHLVFGIRFARAPRLVLTLATVFAGTFLTGSARGVIDLLPFLPPLAQRSTAQNAGGQSMRPLLPFGGYHFQFGSYAQQFGFAELLAIGASIAAIAGLVAFLSFSRWGKAIRALAENAERTSLMGISVGMVSLSAWMISAGLGGLSDILSGTVYAPARVYNAGNDALLIPIAAAVLARMRSFWTATAATLTLTVLHEAVQFQYPGQDSLLDLGLFLILGVGLLVRPVERGRTAGEATSWQGTVETRPVPPEMASVPLIRALRWGAIGLVGAFLLALPFITDVSNLELASSICLTAIVVISLVVLTGWAGQASFGQYAFALVATLVAGNLSAHAGVTFWIAVPLAAVFSGGLAVLLGFPALRVPGSFLVVVTFALAIAAHTLLFDPRYFGWADPGLVHRPTLFLIDFENEKWMYSLAIVLLAGTIFAVRNLRRTRFGRLVIAARDNPADLEAAGINVVRLKLTAFGLSGLLAGLAGAVLAYQQFGANQQVYDPSQSLLVFQMLIVGGASTISGALLGTLTLYGVTQLATLVPGSAVFLSALPLLILWATPGGLLAALANARDALLRIIAQRNEMIVPSLYGDIDPDALRLRLIPLGKAAGDGAAHGFRIETSRLRWIGLRHAGAGAADSSTVIASAGELARAEPTEPVEPEVVG